MIIVAKFEDKQTKEFKNVNKIVEENGRRIEIFDYDNKLLSRIDNKYVTFTIKRNE
jgi:hypothetical protein